MVAILRGSAPHPIPFQFAYPMKKNSPRASHPLAALVMASVALLFAPSMLGLAPAAQAAAVLGLPDFTDLVEEVGPAVVNIRTTERMKTVPGQGASSEEEMQELLRRFFGSGGAVAPDQAAPHGRKPAQPEEPIQRGVGSGFIISADGYVLTNAHVVDGADEVIVTLTDQREFKARVLGADARTDVALLKIEGGKLPLLKMGDSNKIRVGEWVIAIGSPFNLENTVTAGIISAKSRDTGDYLPLIQSDVAVNPGNSGGPLINMRGEVIGINSQIATLSGGYNGISFAVPIDEAMRVADQIKKTGKVTRGRIGVQISELSKDTAAALGLPDAKGAQVSMVEPAGPAEKAGIKAGDIILKFNGVTIERSSDLPRVVGGTALGSQASVTVWRQGALRTITVTVAELESDKVAGKASPKPAPAARPSDVLGLTVSELSAAKKKELQLDVGVMVDVAKGSAARAGLQAGDVILQVNNTEVKNVAQFNAAVAKLDPKKAAVLLVRRGDVAQYVELKALAR